MRAVASVASLFARVCWAEESCNFAEARLEALWARCEAFPPARAVASADSADCRLALSEASVAFACAASIRAMTCPRLTREPTLTVRAVSVPLVPNVGDEDCDGDTLPDAETLDCTSPRETVTVRAMPLAADDDVR